MRNAVAVLLAVGALSGCGGEHLTDLQQEALQSCEDKAPEDRDTCEAVVLNSSDEELRELEAFTEEFQEGVEEFNDSLNQP